MVNIIKLLDKRRTHGTSLNADYFSKEKVPPWHVHTLKNCAPPELLLGHCFLGFTSSGRFLLSYTVQQSENDETIVESFFYHLHWWLIEHNSNSNSLAIKVVKKCSLFNSQPMPEKLLIWIYHWPNDDSKIVAHGVEKMYFNSPKFNHDSLGSLEDEYLSVIDILPNPAITCGTQNTPCLSHDWQLSIKIPTLKSFKLPPFYRDVCVVNNGLIYTNGYSIKFLEISLNDSNDNNRSKSVKNVISEKSCLNVDEFQECTDLNVTKLPTTRYLKCRSDYRKPPEQIFDDGDCAYHDQNTSPNEVLASLVLNFSDGSAATHGTSNNNTRNDDQKFLKITEVSLGIEEMIETILNQKFSQLQNYYNLELQLADYTTIILAVCPISFNVVFKTPVVFIDRNSGTAYKSSFVMRWNFVTRRFEILKSKGISKSTNKQFDYDNEVKPSISKNWRSELRDLPLPVLEVPPIYDNNLPVFLGLSKNFLFNKSLNLLLTL